MVNTDDDAHPIGVAIVNFWLVGMGTALFAITVIIFSIGQAVDTLKSNRNNNTDVNQQNDHYKRNLGVIVTFLLIIIYVIIGITQDSSYIYTVIGSLFILTSYLCLTTLRKKNKGEGSIRDTITSILGLLITVITIIFAVFFIGLAIFDIFY